MPGEYSILKAQVKVMKNKPRAFYPRFYPYEMKICNDSILIQYSNVLWSLFRINMYLIYIVSDKRGQQIVINSERQK